MSPSKRQRQKDGTDGLLRERRKDGCVHSFEADEPSGYAQSLDWAEKKILTHDQGQCEKCGLWVVWTPRAAVDSVGTKSGPAELELPGPGKQEGGS